MMSGTTTAHIATGNLTQVASVGVVVDKNADHVTRVLALVWHEVKIGLHLVRIWLAKLARRMSVIHFIRPMVTPPGMLRVMLLVLPSVQTGMILRVTVAVLAAVVRLTALLLVAAVVLVQTV